MTTISRHDDRREDKADRKEDRHERRTTDATPIAAKPAKQPYGEEITGMESELPPLPENQPDGYTAPQEQRYRSHQYEAGDYPPDERPPEEVPPENPPGEPVSQRRVQRQVPGVRPSLTEEEHKATRK